MFVYPSGDLDNPQRVNSLLGALWNSLYVGRDFLRVRAQARCANARQNVQDLQEATQCVSRLHVPLYHRENWVPLRLKQSDTTNSDAAMWRWDDPEIVFNGEVPFRFDRPLTTSVAFPLPEGLVRCSCISDQLRSPLVSWHSEIDFRILPERGAIVFRRSPFDDNRLAIRPVFSDGDVTDHELTLWLFRPLFDRRFVYEHVGYVVGLEEQTSQAYKDALNTTLDAVVGGTAREQVAGLMSAISDIPLVKSRDEVVKDTYRDDFLWVITDQNVYRYHRDAELLTSVGETVQSGQALADGLVEWRPWEGLPDEIPAVVVPRGLLGDGFLGDLVFENKLVELAVSGASDDLKVTFAIGGFPADVERFWTLTHSRRLIYGQSLHDLLLQQQRPLPATINPADFAAKNLLRNNFLMYWLRADRFGPSAFELGTVDLLRKIVPPHQTVLVFLELAQLSQSVKMTTVTESIDTYEAMPRMSQAVNDLTVIAELPQIVSFTCH